MRYLIIKELGEVIGIVTVPEGNLVGSVFPYDSKAYVYDTTKAEYETFKALSLFPEYKVVMPVGGMTTIYNPKIYKVKGQRIVKRGKRDERERRKKAKQEKW